MSNLDNFRATGRRIAQLVVQAEDEIGAGQGPRKRAWVLNQIIRTIPIPGPCAPLLRSLLKLALSALVEAALAGLKRAAAEAAAPVVDLASPVAEAAKP